MFSVAVYSNAMGVTSLGGVQVKLYYVILCQLCDIWYSTVRCKTMINAHITNKARARLRSFGGPRHHRPKCLVDTDKIVLLRGIKTVHALLSK